jgi:hypothetical protein
MRPSSQVPIETHAAIYGVALIIIFKLTKTLFPEILKMLSHGICQNLMIFLAGLCLRDKNQSAHGIAKFFGLKSHDALTKVLVHKSWSASLLILQLLNKAIGLSLCSPLQSWLILDDVILPKRRSEKSEGIYWDWDYVNRKNILCLRLVVLVWTNGLIRIPVAFACYYKKNSDYLRTHQKKFRTKNQIACCLVYQVVRKGLNFDYLLFDSWYASEDNFIFFSRLKTSFVAGIKYNRNIYLPYFPLENRPKRHSKNLRWHKLTCTEWASEKPYVRDYAYYKSVEARARQTLVCLKGTETFMKLVCIKNYATNKAFKKLLTSSEKKAKDKNKYLITNDPALTIPQTIKWYRRRWDIEVLFRDCKQHLAFGKCQAHKSLEPHLRHTAMVFLAYTLLELTKPNSQKDNPIHKTIGELKRNLQNQQIIYVKDRYYLIDMSKTRIDWQTFNLLDNHLNLNELQSRETQLALIF